MLNSYLSIKPIQLGILYTLLNFIFCFSASAQEFAFAGNENPGGGSIKGVVSSTDGNPVGFVNVFTFGKYRNEMKVTELTPNKRVKWECIDTPEKEWMDTNISFDVEEKGERTILLFSHAGWTAVTDTFASCNYDWAMFMKSLKSYCENGSGTPA